MGARNTRRNWWGVMDAERFNRLRQTIYRGYDNRGEISEPYGLIAAGILLSEASLDDLPVDYEKRFVQAFRTGKRDFLDNIFLDIKKEAGIE